MRKTLVYWMLCCGIWGNAQKHDYIWLLGYESRHMVPGIEISELNFNETPVAILHNPNVVLEFSSTNANICDADGNLQFYTNGCTVANYAHEVMENGDNINAGEVHDIVCQPSQFNSYSAVNQNVLILPDPGNADRYYMLHKRIIYTDGGGNSFDVVTDRLLYTLVDMSANGGLGAVIEKNELIIADSMSSGKLTAVKHANGQDWWIVDSREFSVKYYVMLLDSSGIHNPMVQFIGQPTLERASGNGQAVFSPDGTRYARYGPYDDIHLFDFDRATGTLSNFQLIPVENDTVQGGAAFSPSGRYFYATSPFNIQQFDLWADDIVASGQVVAEYDGYVSPFPTLFNRAQLGPDCRIYVFCGSCDVVHVIQYPDEAGVACGVEQHAIQLPYSMFRSAALFPNYRLGPLDDPGEPCTPLVSVAAEPAPTASGLRLWPNPAGDWAHLAWPVGEAAPRALWLYDALGRRQALSWQEAGPGEVQFSVAHLPAGVYWLALQSAGGAGAVTIRFVKQ